MDGDHVPPLLVKIQSIDTNSLDFNGVKSRNATCIETSNLFLFIGCASGTTYVFSRETLKFLFVIAFKGGKVCYISCSPDESDVSIGSVRGKVSVYRISPNLHVTPLCTSPGECVKHLYEIPHHADSEITEMKWSPNGKFLFVSDSHGTVTQVDVGSLDEFPRPPPSQIILEAGNRVLQMDCVFPYLAVCCITGVFLCDLEKEDFTRVKASRKKDIKATGVTFKLIPSLKYSRENVSELCLFIGDVVSGRILRCSMQGKIFSSEKVIFGGINSQCLNIFDPKELSPVALTKSNNTVTIPQFALGKLFSAENHCIVTLLNDRLFIIDSKTLNVVEWCEDFHRIKSLTMLSNYMFIWHGSRVDVVSFTEFRPYALQLLNAGLSSVLERWVNHTVNSVGWKELNQEDGDLSSSAIDIVEEQNLKSIKTFESLVGELNCEESLCSFIVPLLPFKMPNLEEIYEFPSKAKEPVDLITTAILKFMQACQEIQVMLEDQIEFPHYRVLVIMWVEIQRFYMEMGAVIPDMSNLSDYSLAKIVTTAHTFLKQPQLVDLLGLLNETVSRDNTTMEFVSSFLKCISEGSKTFLATKDTCAELNSICFIDSHQVLPLTGALFLPEAENKSLYDFVLADALILVIPLLNEDCLINILTNLDIKDNVSNLMCTWIVLTNFCNEKQYFPYAPLLRTVLSESCNVDAQSLIPLINQDFLMKDVSRPAKFLHHFASVLLVVGSSQSTNFSPLEYRKIVLSTFLSSLPFKHWPKRATFEKFSTICAINPYLLNLYEIACLENDTAPSEVLCSCGIPSSCKNHENIPYSPQRIIEEAILQLLMVKYENIASTGNLISNPAHTFAMKRFLLEPYLKSSFGDKLKCSVKVDLILRAGSSTLLSLLNPNKTAEIDCLINKWKAFSIKECKYCTGCDEKIEISQKFQALSLESIYLWIYTHAGSIDHLINLIERSDLNFKGRFSLRFYKEILSKR